MNVVYLFDSSIPRFATGSPLESEAAFVERATKIGVDGWVIEKFKEKKLASFGKLAFAVPYSPQNPDDRAFRQFVNDVIEVKASADQLATLRRH